MLPHVIQVAILTSCSTSVHVFSLTKIPLTPSDKQYHCPLCRLQYPIRLCFAISINKSQNQTLTTTVLHLDHLCFSPSHSYLTCSRVGWKKLPCSPRKQNEKCRLLCCDVGRPKYNIFPAQPVYGEWVLSLPFFKDDLFFLRLFSATVSNLLTDGLNFALYLNDNTVFLGVL